jgi:hypothetical protein
MGFLKQLFGLGERAHPSSISVKFVREERCRAPVFGNEVVKRIYQAATRAEALEFLRQTPVTKQFYYVEVDTPDGRVGKDLSIIYDGEGKKIADSTPPPDSAIAGQYAKHLFDRSRLLGTAEEALSILRSVPEVRAVDAEVDLLFHANRIFRGSVVDVLTQIGQTAESGSIGTLHRYSSESPVCLLVTGLPWRTVEVPGRFASDFGTSGAGYSLFLESLLSNRQAPHLTHWVHAVICLVDGRLHTAAGFYASGRECWKPLNLPSELLTDSERARFAHR